MPDSIVLCYHALSEQWPAALSTTPARFERQLRILLKRGYRPATLTDAVASPPGERVLAVTFDDAYRSVRELALPILQRLGMPATVFAPTGFIGTEAPMAWEGIDRWLGGPHEHELLPMSWEELELLRRGGWEVGSHTVSHPRLTTLDDDALAEELSRSKASCEERLGAGACTTLAYPYGDEDRRVVEAARLAGYASAVTLPKRLHEPSPLRWPRVGVYHVDDELRFRLKVSERVAALRRSPLGGLAERMRG